MVKCWRCGSELEEVETYFEAKGVVVRGVKGLRCPKDGEEIFTEEQVAEIRRRIAEAAKLKPLRLRRKLSASGKRPAVLLPEDIVRSTGVKVGDEIDIYQEGRRIVIEPVVEHEEES